MDWADLDLMATSFEGVRRRPGVPAQWRYRGRLVARQLDDEHVVIRCAFPTREDLVREHPDTFSVPGRFRRHMMVVADLRAGDPEAIEDALAAAAHLQSHDG
ncbi:hypothetical protein [Ornithinimicrobium cavernae]|uniref:hypothetical protein n=1 Tax=Ornithinimicrobium cavernae TaxID=2666047 RepID=UPI000D6888E2|nr:hypothetical protein [Ornithinimicrobium cavernae]